MHDQFVITGLGVVAPGAIADPSQLWDRVIDGPGVAAPITRFDPSTFAVRIGGQVDDAQLADAIDARTKRTTSHAAQLAICAGHRAIADAGGVDLSEDGFGWGVYTGTALGGWSQAEQQYATLLEKGTQRINPFLVNSSGPHSTSTEVASAIGARGGARTTSTGCASSTQAIGDAVRDLTFGEVDACLAGGAESPLSPSVVAALARTEELSTENAHPATASRPFDRQHSGMVLSEGACFLAVENKKSAIARGARIYAEVVGGASSCDGRGLYHFDGSAETAARTIDRLLRRTGVTPDQIDYVCAHANSSPAFDGKEVAVLKKALGEFAAKIPVSSIKGVLGHAFGASGAFQSAVAAMAIQRSIIPPTHNLEQRAPECGLDLVIREPRKTHIRHALVTSYGYGGVNSFLLLRDPDA